MANLLTTAVARQLGSLFEGSSVVGLSDRQLLERFNAQPDDAAQAAFAAIVSRHGPMVLEICRQSLGDLQHAEDAFQAVFFVLARRARSIQDPDLLGNWLYGVALRTARKAKRRLDRRRAHEAGAITQRSEPDSCATDSAQETAIARERAEALHDEISRLPVPFRVSVVLCYFEGLSLDEAAQRLGCPAGTVHSRLDRARNKLRRGLIRRGIVLSAATRTGILESKAAWASISPSLADIATQGAIRFANRTAVAGALSASATTLAHDVLRSMVVKKLTLAAIALVFLGTLTTVASMGPALARPSPEAQPPNRQAGPPDLHQNAKPDDAEPKPAPGRMFVTGRVLDPNGKPVPGAAVVAYARARSVQQGPLPNRANAGDAPLGDTRADGSGSFRIDAPRISSSRHEEFNVIALAPGYGVAWVTLDPDDDRPTADITLRPEQVIHGRLFDLQGQPVPNVTLSVSSVSRIVREPPAGVRARFDGVYCSFTKINDFPAWPKPVTTNPDGRYTLRGLSREQGAGLVVHHSGFGLQVISVEANGNADSKPTTAALAPAQVLTGRVTYADTGKGVPHAPLEVMASMGRAGFPADFETDAEGRFRLNPPPADRSFGVTAFPPSGVPYTSAWKRIEWPKGALEQSLDLALPRGVSIHGKVTEAGSGTPIAGATVGFIDRVSGRSRETLSMRLNTSADGSFQIGVVPRPGYLVVRAPSDDYVRQAISTGMLDDGQPGGRLDYADGFSFVDLKPGLGSQEVNLVLRRGVTVTGRVVGPDGQPVPDAWMFSRIHLSARRPLIWVWSGSEHGIARDGRFELHGLEPNAEVLVSFLEPKRKLGTTVRLPGKSARGEPIVVKLEPCIAAKARLVGLDGKPLGGLTPPSLINMVVTPGEFSLIKARRDSSLMADQAVLQVIDPINYPNDETSDAEGRIVLPALIPGATYRFIDNTTVVRGKTGPRVRKEFTAKPGETPDLGDILIEKPGS